MKQCKKILSLLLVVCMVVMVLPISAFAADYSDIELTKGGKSFGIISSVGEANMKLIFEASDKVESKLRASLKTA